MQKVRRDLRLETSREEYARIYGDSTDAEVSALFQMFGEIVHTDPMIVQGLLHLVRTKH